MLEVAKQDRSAQQYGITLAPHRLAPSSNVTLVIPRVADPRSRAQAYVWHHHKYEETGAMSECLFCKLSRRTFRG